MIAPRRQRLAFLAVMLVTIGLGARGITDEASVMLSGDMARYVMNGVFIHDLIASGGVRSFDDLVRYAEHYYARYPALSLGHHPPLLYVVLAPFYAVFGVSLFSARLAALAFFVLAAWGLYGLAKRLFGWQAATWATLLFVTNLVVLRSGQYALSEMPMLALVLASFNALVRYCDTGHRKFFAWFVLAAAASLYAKQLAVFIFPVYAIVLIGRLGWRHLLRPHIVLLTIVGAVAVAPLVALTLALAPANVGLVTRNIETLAKGTRRYGVDDILAMIIGGHLSWPTLLASGFGMLSLLVERNRWTLVCLAWVASVWLGTVIFAAGYEPARYAMGAMPAYFLLAVGLTMASPSSRIKHRIVWLTLSGALLWQAWLVREVHPSGAGGYETAAEFVIRDGFAPVILFDGEVDTGYFVFFVRKNDPTGQRIVLRAEQVLRDPGAVRATLQKFGVQFVVVEEGLSPSVRQHPLHLELQTDRFTERARIPIRTTETRARNAELVVYEYRDARPPDMEAQLTLGIRLARRGIQMTLGDLLGMPRQ